MSQTTTDNRKVLKGIVDSIPIYSVVKDELINIPYQNHLLATQKQSFYNSLVSQYDHTVPYNPISNKTSLEYLEKLSNDPDNNLILNIRKNVGEFEARYVFGFVPNNVSSDTYYAFSDVCGATKLSNDYYFSKLSNLEEYILPQELSKLHDHHMLLSTPLVIKYWNELSDYLNDVDLIKTNLSALLTSYDCPLYANMVAKLPYSGYSVIQERHAESAKEAFLILLSNFIQKEIMGSQYLTNDEVGTNLYKITNGQVNRSMNTQFPPLKGLSVPSMKKSVTFTDDHKLPLGDKIRSFKPTSGELQMMRERLRPSRGGTQEPVEFIDTSCNTDPFVLENKISIPQMKKRPKVEIGSVSDLQYLLFGPWINPLSNFYKNKMEELYKILSSSEVYYTHYELFSMDFNSFVIIDSDIDKVISAYMLYFNVLQELLTTANDDRARHLCGCLIVALNNFGHFVFGDVKAFRFKLDNFYVLGSRFSQPIPSKVGLVSAAMDTIASFMKIFQDLVGGSTSEMSYDYTPVYFDFFKHVYLLELLAFKRKGTPIETGKNVGYVSPHDLFWFGVPLKDFSNMSIETQSAYTKIYKVFFLDEMNSRLSTSHVQGNMKGSVCMLSDRIMLDKFYTTREVVDMVLNRVNTLDKEVPIKDLVDVTEEEFGSPVISNSTALKTIDKNVLLPKAIDILSQRTTTEPTTFLETFLFIFVLLEKMGFNVTKKNSATNIEVIVKPALMKQNLENIFNISNAPELNKGFVQKHRKFFEFIIDNSVVQQGGVSSSLFVSLETPVSSYKHQEQIENEKATLDEALGILERTSSLSIDNLVRLVPSYVKQQRHIIARADRSGGSLTQGKIFQVFLDRVKVESKENIDRVNAIPDEIVIKNIDKYIQESHLKSLEHLILFYDNRIAVDDGKSNNFALFNYTFNTMRYLKSINVEFDSEIKKDLTTYLLSRDIINEHCYRIFLVVQYIKNVMGSLFNLGLLSSTNMLSVDGYKKFTAIIDERLKHKKTLFKSMLKHKVAIINKKLNTNFVLNEEYDLNSLLSNNIITQDIIISDKDKPADGLEAVGKIKTLLKTIGEVDTTPLYPVTETVEMLEKNIKKEVDAKLGTMTPEEINEFTAKNLE